MTWNEVVVSFDPYRQNHFKQEQIYVVLSQTTSLQGLHVTGKVENKHVRANPKVHTEYQRMKQLGNSYSSSSTNDEVNDFRNLKVCLLNILSLRKHSIDIKYDASVSNCDITALTEIQLLPYHSDDTIRETLRPYELHKQDHPTDKYSSLAICTKHNINILEKQYFPTINDSQFNVFNSNTGKMTSFLLIYKKNSTNTTQYADSLNNNLRTHTMDIIFGDLNINYFDEFGIMSLKELMNSYGYIQIVNKPTFVSAGSLLDQVYVNQFLSNKVQNEVNSVFYSDHDSVQTTISDKM